MIISFIVSLFVQLQDSYTAKALDMLHLYVNVFVYIWVGKLIFRQTDGVCEK